MTKGIQAFLRKWLLGLEYIETKTETGIEQTPITNLPINIEVDGIKREIPINAKITIRCTMAKWEMGVTDFIEIMDKQQKVEPAFSLYKTFRKLGL